jgi:hypothetical protein
MPALLTAITSFIYCCQVQPRRLACHPAACSFTYCYHKLYLQLYLQFYVLLSQPRHLACHAAALLTRFTYSQCRRARLSTALLAALLLLHKAVEWRARHSTALHTARHSTALHASRTACTPCGSFTYSYHMLTGARTACDSFTYSYAGGARHVTGLLTRIICLQARRRARHADATRLRRAPARPSACRAAQIRLANQV